MVGPSFNHTVRRSFVVSSLSFMICSLSLLACRRAPEKPSLTLYPVRGTLIVDGKPASGAIVTLHRQPSTSDGRSPIGMVDERGEFQLGYLDEQDGAPAGTYQLLVYWPENSGALAADRLKGRFTDPKNPVTTIVVREQENLLPAIQIRSRSATSDSAP